MTNPLDVQIAGGHYKGGGIQPVEFIVANDLGFCEGNIIKYVFRHKQKGGRDDLLKARHYIDLLIKLSYPEEHVHHFEGYPTGRCACGAMTVSPTSNEHL